MQDKVARKTRVSIRHDTDVVVACQKGRTLAAQVGLSDNDQVIVTIAISEVASNIIRYANTGEIILEPVLQDDKRGIVIIARDEGPGITDVKQALQDGYSTGGGLGLGLSGARRLMDEFEIVTQVGMGTTIVMKKMETMEMTHLQSTVTTEVTTPSAQSTPFIEWGIATRSFDGRGESGDQCLVEPFSGGILVMVVDGLGHGPSAAIAGKAAVAAVEGHASEPVAALLKRCHEGLRRTRGAVVSLASFDAHAGKMTWLGIGNVKGLLLRANGNVARTRERLLLRGGVVGYQLPTLRPATLSVGRGDTLILATDGLRSVFADELVIGDAPQQMADRIFDQYRRGTDDAMVLVARYIGPDDA
ncbi:MAG: SpoIIE family protein phosphatase [Chloroflexi bacterium]|nr:SpoIIE family protein phosphatase [Chloroflexota bacterium]